MIEFLESRVLMSAVPATHATTLHAIAAHHVRAAQPQIVCDQTTLTVFVPASSKVKNTSTIGILTLSNGHKLTKPTAIVYGVNAATGMLVQAIGATVNLGKNTAGDWQLSVTVTSKMAVGGYTIALSDPGDPSVRQGSVQLQALHEF